MEHPTAFFQELAQALSSMEDACTVPEDFSIYVIETHDSEKYRIQWQVGRSIIFWEGSDWPTVLAECLADQKSPL